MVTPTDLVGMDQRRRADLVAPVAPVALVFFEFRIGRRSETADDFKLLFIRGGRSETFVTFVTFVTCVTVLRCKRSARGMRGMRSGSLGSSGILGRCGENTEGRGSRDHLIRARRCDFCGMSLSFLPAHTGGQLRQNASVPGVRPGEADYGCFLTSLTFCATGRLARLAGLAGLGRRLQVQAGRRGLRCGRGHDCPISRRRFPRLTLLVAVTSHFLLLLPAGRLLGVTGPTTDLLRHHLDSRLVVASLGPGDR